MSSDYGIKWPVGDGRWMAWLGGYSAMGTTAWRAADHLKLLIAWHDAPNGWRTWLAALRLELHTRFFF